MMVDFLAGYFQNIEKYPIRSHVEPGEMLSAGLTVVGFSWIASPAATELESIVMDWLGKMINLPKTYLFSSGHGGGGVIQG
ncbi:hypothetical protein H5410_041138 [Solanum commersonii]|uniref:Uncharacterized protein n=1 Tax=Solanum commersonii TaxID=4109 RepID=A0A9J5XTY8_SOLCO|nr:hypothetical protein H5410_041138 [Solanum commersonii]